MKTLIQNPNGSLCFRRILGSIGFVFGLYLAYIQNPYCNEVLTASGLLLGTTAIDLFSKQ